MFRKLSGLGVIYIIVCCIIFLLALEGSSLVTNLSENAVIHNRTCVIIDAGHGGVDGGATSCTGVLESKFNLDIALKLEDLCHLLGFKTKMIRDTDISVHTEGTTIASKKVSDLKHRVKIANETQNAILISIHQNYFSESKYSGAQLFYAKTQGSAELANHIQNNIRNFMAKDNTRQTKYANGVYLMQHIKCTGVLIECGFISNPEEESKLRDNTYQRRLCCIIGATLSNYLDPVEIG